MIEELIKVFLVDDHHLFREGIRGILESFAPVKVVCEAANGKEVLALLPKVEVDVLVLDVDMPEMNGLELMNQLSKHYPSINVLIFSTHSDTQYINHLMLKGAKGYILKNCKKGELISAIKTVSNGNSYLSHSVSQKLFQSSEKTASETIDSNPLTTREIEVLRLVAQGLTNQEIGKMLYISHRTVDTHRRNMMTKLDLHNAAALTKYAAQNGLLMD